MSPSGVTQSVTKWGHPEGPPTQLTPEGGGGSEVDGGDIAQPVDKAQATDGVSEAPAL